MAKRYGGQFSPNAPKQSDSTPKAFARKQVSPVGARANALFIPAIPLVATSLNEGAIALSLALAGAATWTLAAWLLRGGLEAEAAYHARKIAKRPAIPRKLFSAVLTGLGAALAVLAHGEGLALLSAGLFAVIAGGLHLASFGLDPMRDKSVEGIDQFQQNRVARVVDQAEAHLAQMTDAIRRSGDREMEAEVEAFKTVARDMIRTVEEDPRDLTAARKYLGVYLLGARDATAKFADIHARSRDAQARADYAALLTDLTENFSARTRKLLVEDRTDLTVEIDVLRERLARDGVQINGTE